MKKNFDSNQERTRQHFENFNKEIVLSKLINRHDPIIFDVGSNYGSSIVDFKKIWPNSKIHAFEPQLELKENLLEVSRRYENVIINMKAAGDKTQIASFYTHEQLSAQAGFNQINFESKDSINLSKFNEIELNEYKNSNNIHRQVEVIKMSEYVNENQINEIDLLKIDTQGFEPEVLKGFESKLSTVKVVLCELMFYDFYDRSLSFSDIEKFLLPFGFKLYDISHISKNPMNGRTDWVDVIYLRN